MSESTSTIVPNRFPMARVTWAGLTRPVHVGIVEQFEYIIDQWERRGGQSVYRIYSWWGYATRPQDKGAHPRGVGIDVNPADNPMVAKRNPCPSDMPRWFVDLWKAQGFGWGGDWSSKCDAMHMSKLPYEGGNGRIYERPSGLVVATSIPTTEEDEMLQLGSVGPNERVTLSIDGPAVATKDKWCWLVITPTGPPKKDTDRDFFLWIEGVDFGGWPGFQKGVGCKQHKFEIKSNVTMVHIHNIGKADLGYSVAVTKRPS